MFSLFFFILIFFFVQCKRLRRCGGLWSRAAAGHGCRPRCRQGSWRSTLQRRLEGSLYSLHGARSSRRALLHWWRGFSEDRSRSSGISRSQGKEIIIFLIKIILYTVSNWLYFCLPVVRGRKRCSYCPEIRLVSQSCGTVLCFYFYTKYTSDLMNIFSTQILSWKLAAL